MAKKRLEKKNIRMLKQGDTEAFEAMFHIYKDQLFLFAMTLVDNKMDAEEVVQETFLAVSKSISDLDDEKKFHAWIFRICYNQAMLLHRKNKKSATVKEDIDIVKEARVAEDPHVIYKRKDIMEAIHSEIEDLPVTLRQTAQLYYLNSLKIKEISEILDIPEGTVKNRILRSKSIMKEKLEIRGYAPKTVFSFGLLMSQASSTNPADELIKNRKNHHSSRLGMKVATTLALATGAYLIIDEVTNQPIEIIEVQYDQELTSQSLLIKVLTNQDINDENITIQYAGNNIKFQIHKNEIAFVAPHNGDYHIQIESSQKVVSLGNIDTEYPMLTDIQYIEDRYLLLQCQDLGSGIDYEKSYIEYQGKQINIPRNHQVKGEFLGQITIVLYDQAGNQTRDIVEVSKDLIKRGGSGV